MARLLKKGRRSDTGHGGEGREASWGFNEAKFVRVLRGKNLEDDELVWTPGGGTSRKEEHSLCERAILGHGGLHASNSSQLILNE